MSLRASESMKRRCPHPVNVRGAVAAAFIAASAYPKGCTFAWLQYPKWNPRTAPSKTICDLPERASLSGHRMRPFGKVSRSAMAAPVEDITKHIRLPVWPAWFGVFYIILDWLTGDTKTGAALEDRFGGRVCPMIFRDTRKTNPFLLIAHHRHSFNPFDPLRYIFRSVLMPEGFPAHPHRGFETVTYVLRGGLDHRDSYGVKKSYGAPPDADGTGEGAAVQWMTAGRGLQHEEMWRTGSAFDSTDQELFQIWVNLPASSKMVAPRMQILGNNDAEPCEPLSEQRVPVIELGPVPHVSPSPGVTVRVVAGEADGMQSPIETCSDLAILHVTLKPDVEWSWPRPMGWNCIVYVRRGEVLVGAPDRIVVPLHSTATLGRNADEVVLLASNEGADLLILAGEPISEPIEMGSNVIMNTPSELAKAEQDLSEGEFGPDWDFTLDDASWKEMVRRHWEMRN